MFSVAHISKDLSQSSGCMEITWDWDPKDLDCNPSSHVSNGNDFKNPPTLLCLCDWEDGVIFLAHGFLPFWRYFRKFSRRWLKHLGAFCVLPDKLVQGKCAHILLYFLGPSLPMLFFRVRSGPPALLSPALVLDLSSWFFPSFGNRLRFYCTTLYKTRGRHILNFYKQYQQWCRCTFLSQKFEEWMSRTWSHLLSERERQGLIKSCYRGCGSGPERGPELDLGRVEA